MPVVAEAAVVLLLAAYPEQAGLVAAAMAPMECRLTVLPKTGRTVWVEVAAAVVPTPWLRAVTAATASSSSPTRSSPPQPAAPSA
jgi:hypothetical protein